MAREKLEKPKLTQNPTYLTPQSSLREGREIGQMVALKVKPTEPETLKSVISKLRTLGYRHLVQIGIENLSTQYPSESIGFYLHYKGIKADNFIEVVRSSRLFTNSQKNSLMRAAKVMKDMEKAEPKQTKLLQSAAREPDIEVTEYPEVDKKPSKQVEPGEEAVVETSTEGPVVEQVEPTGGVVVGAGTEGPVVEQEEPLVQAPIEPGVEYIVFAPQAQEVHLSLNELRLQITQNPVVNIARNYVQNYAKDKLLDISKRAAKSATKVVGKEVAKKAVEVGAKAGAKFALRETISNIITALGSVTGPLAILIKALSYLVSELLMKIASYFKKHSKEFAAIGMGLVASGLIFGSGPAIAVGLFLFGAGGLGAGLPAAAATTLTAAIAIIATLTATFIKAILIGAGIAMVSLIVFTSFALLVINQSAYIVPYNPDILDPSQPGPMESKYIKVTKTAKSSNPPRSESNFQEYENDDVPNDGLVITYTITITPKLGSLRDISFSSQCNVSKENANPPCPPEENIAVSPPPLTTPVVSPPALSFPPSPPSLISPSSPYIITYTQTYDRATYEDSIIVDSFIVTATATDGETSTASGIATVIIGEPPMDCPAGWPVREDVGRIYWITQGTNTRHTHKGWYANAIDVSSFTSANAYLDEVISTHRGTVVTRRVDQYGGLYIEVEGICTGTRFISRHVHFDSFDSNVTIGTDVVRGTTLGIMGSTGWASHRHDHYQFNGIKMGEPYIPENVPEGCVGRDECGNMRIPNPAH